MGSGNIVYVTRQERFLLAKYGNSEMSSLRKTENSSFSLLANVASGNRNLISQK